MDTKNSLKQEILAYLGHGMVRVELTDPQLELAIKMALETYRRYCSTSTEEAWLHVSLIEGQVTYTLPKEVQEVRKIFRRGNGVVQGTGSTVDPFSLAYSNSYLLSAVRGSTGGGLLTYELYHEFDKTVGRLFGREITFTWDRVTKNLTLHRDIRGDEDILLWAYQHRPDAVLFEDYLSRPWLRNWAIAESKIMLGSIRGKISAIPGPNGAINLNGDALIQEGNQEKEKLMDEIKKFGAGGTPLGFFWG